MDEDLGGERGKEAMISGDIRGGGSSRTKRIPKGEMPLKDQAFFKGVRKTSTLAWKLGSGEVHAQTQGS